ncbi:MAG TPA: tetratricopeptide repeat protein [Anaerolineales bacterium]|nr:tetratricopeptide repeat protein [Anaerolineales bacterium]
MKKFFTVCMVIVLLFLASCAPAPANAPSADTQPADDAQPEANAASSGDNAQETSQEPESVPTATPIPRPTSSASVCVPPSEHPPLSMTTYTEYPQIVMDYLNAGASPEELAVELIVNELSPNEAPVWSEDLTQDGVRDLVVTVLDKENPPQGALMIYTCTGSQYVLSHVVVSPQDYYAPRLLYIQDMNDDGLREVLYSSTTCVTPTCYEDIQIISWANGVFVPHLEGSTVELPAPDAKLTDFDQNGVYDLEVVGKIVSDVAAGPQRNTINIWSYDPASGNWKRGEQSLASSPFRIHLVHDAEDAMDREEYLIGALLFEQVITDENLLDWSDPVDEFNTLSAYAYYKQIVAYVFLGDRATALAIYDEFVEEYGGTAQYGYVEMADAFLTDSEVLGLEGGCTSARQYAASNEFLVLMPLGSSVYGYTNRDFTAEDICP